MADEVVVTELTIDARGADQGSAAFVRAMQAAQNAYDKTIDQANLAAAAMEKQTVVMTKATGSITATSRAWERLKASVDPAYRSTKEIEKAMLDADAAARKLGVDADEIARVMDLVRAKQAGAAGSLAASANASKMASYELRNLKFQLIDIAQSIPLAFQSPLYFLQNLGFQFAQIGQIFMGRGGFGAAISEVGSIVGSLVSRFARIGVAIGGVVAGFGAIRDAASEAEKRTVGWGETFVATWDVIKESFAGQAASALWQPISYALGKLGSAAVDIAELIINSFHAAFVDVKLIWDALPASFGLTFAKAANFGIEALNLLIKKSSDAVDQIIVIFNRLGADIPLLNAGKQTIPPIDEKPYLDSLDKLVSDRNAKINEIMSSTPIRDFGQAVVDKIAKNRALDEIDSLGKVDFSTSISGANSFGSAVSGIGKAAEGVKIEFGGVAQQAINVTKLFDDAKRSQLAGLEASRVQLQGMNEQLRIAQNYLRAAAETPIADVFGSQFGGAGGEAAISNAVSTIDKVFKAFDDGRMSISDVDQAIELVRQSLAQMGGDTKSVDAFVNKVVNAQLAVRQLKSNVDNLSQSIRTIPNRTVTITVRTQRIGSGTQSLYDVPNSSGGTSTVGVTRYGGDGSSSGPSITSNSVPRTSGYGSMGGSGDLGNTNVTVTRFATGGMIHPGDTQRVQFFKSPDETVGIFTPRQMAALADPQGSTSAPSAEQDKLTLAITDTATNTKKTAQILDDIKTSTAGASSAFGGSSSGGSFGVDTSQQAQLSAQYAQVLKQIRSNFAAAGIVGRGIIGYGLDGLASSPEDIARNIVYGGAKSVGFASGGMIGGDSRDTMKVQFFKRPSEKVIIVDNDQVEDRRRSSPSGGGVTFSQINNWKGSEPPSQESLAAVRRATALGLIDAQRSINGR